MKLPGGAAPCTDARPRCLMRPPPRLRCMNRLLQALLLGLALASVPALAQEAANNTTEDDTTGGPTGATGTGGGGQVPLLTLVLVLAVVVVIVLAVVALSRGD